MLEAQFISYNAETIDWLILNTFEIVLPIAVHINAMVEVVDEWKLD